MFDRLNMRLIDAIDALQEVEFVAMISLLGFRVEGST